MQAYRAAFSALPEIQTQRLLLRRLRMDDARDMYAYSSDPRVSRHVLWETHATIRDTRAVLRGALRQYRAGDPASYAIVARETGRMIGTIGFMWVNYEHKSAEVGYSLAFDCWNKGYATEALIAVLDYAFRTLRLNRVEAQHDVENPASGRVMEKAGMQREGVLRQRVLNKGRFMDVVLYAALKNDWKRKESSDVHL